MTTDFRALCTELVDIITAHANPDDYAVGYVAGVLTRARAALADVPDGREPAAVTRQPSHEEWDALVERVWDKYQTVGYQGERFMYDGDFGSALDLVRKELFRWGHQPAPPADGEVAELVETLKGIAYWRRHGKPGEPAPTSFDIRQADRLDRAAELLQRQVLVPVSVSERLPEPSDCAPWPDEPAASAWCWVGSDVDGGWSWEQRSAGCLAAFPDDFTHWLPAHALPNPHQQENAND